MPRISVIVPVYNTEKYLSRCLDSLVNQTFNDIEIIIINDGSTDNSEKIIKEYEEKYSNKIRYFKKKNEGIAATRNYGIEYSKGEYIVFVDSDDYIDLSLFNNLNKYTDKKVDIIKYKLITVDENIEKINNIEGPVFDCISGEEAFNILFSSDVLLESPCLYLFNREFIIKNKFQFLKNTYHEDFGLIPLIILKAKSIISTDIFGYYYVQSKNSITRNEDYGKTLKRAYDLLAHYDNMIKALDLYHINIKTKENIKVYFTNSILLKVRELNNKDKNLFIKEIKKRNLIDNIKVNNLKQLVKKMMLIIDIRLYLKFK